MTIAKGELIAVSCPRVLVVLDHPVTVESPLLDNIQARIFACAALMGLCFLLLMDRHVGISCTSGLFLQNVMFSSNIQTELSIPGKDHPNLIYDGHQS